MSNLTVFDKVDRKPVSGKTVVQVHPLVLLSVVDHYNRSCKGTPKRAVGILLGQWKANDVLDISNSFAVPFEEDAKSPDVWFLDHDFLVEMYTMYRKVSAKERIVGWYHTGPKIRASDLKIHDLISRYVAHPTLVIINPHSSDIGLPTKSYFAVEEVHDDGSAPSKSFEHLASEVSAEEVEEVGVEHLLRDISHLGFAGSLTNQVQTQLSSVKGLHSHIQEIAEYLDLVAAGKAPLNHEILSILQDIFNLLPDVGAPDLSRAMTTTTNDQILVVYLASVLRSVIGLHNLIDNKLENIEAEKKAVEAAEEAEKKKKEKEEAKKAKEAADTATAAKADSS